MLLDLVFIRKAGQGCDGWGKLGMQQSQYDEFKILCGRSRAMSRIATQDFRRATLTSSETYLGCSAWRREGSEIT